MGVLFLILIIDPFMIDDVDPDLPGSMDDTAPVHHQPHMDNIPFFIIKKCKITGFRF